MYKGSVYRQTQRWQDGCEFNCVCVDETTGAYSCDQRYAAAFVCRERERERGGGWVCVFWGEGRDGVHETRT